MGVPVRPAPSHARVRGFLPSWRQWAIIAAVAVVLAPLAFLALTAWPWPSDAWKAAWLAECVAHLGPEAADQETEYGCEYLLGEQLLTRRFDFAVVLLVVTPVLALIAFVALALFVL